MNRFPSKRTDDRAYTLIEIIAVLLVIGILAAVAVSRFLSARQDLVAQADIAKAHLRFAQLKALNDDTASWGIAFAGDSYTLQYNGAAAGISLPGENSNTRALSSGITITTPLTVSFDSWGSPGTSNIPITLSDGGATTTITITGNTGHIAP